MTRRAYIESLSNFCLPNVFDEDRIKGFLEANGFDLVDRFEEADLIVVNTCAFIAEREEASLARVRELDSRKPPGARLVVTGCLPEINPAALGRAFDGVAIGPREIEKLESVIEEPREPFHPDAETHLLPLGSQPLSGWRMKGRWWLKRAVAEFDRFVRIEPISSILDCGTDPRWFYVRTGEGCSGSCTYCGIRVARGRARSRPIERIVEECAAGARDGSRDIMLYGDDVGCYGEDLGTSVAALLAALVEALPGVRIHVYYFHPKWFIDRFDELRPSFGKGRFGLVNLPVQSGNDAVLQAMGRGHTIRPLLECMREARRANPGIVVKTQFLVGFPGETEEQFQDTLAIAGAFDIASAFPFCPRPGTPAASLSNRVPERVTAARRRRLERKVFFTLLRKVRLRAPRDAARSP